MIILIHILFLGKPLRYHRDYGNSGKEFNNPRKGPYTQIEHRVLSLSEGIR